MKEYNTIEKQETSELVEKKSKFITYFMLAQHKKQKRN